MRLPWSSWRQGSSSCTWSLPPKNGQGPVVSRGTAGGLKASGRAAFLDQAEPAVEHAVVLRPIDPGVLMRMVIFLQIVAIIAFTNSAPLSVRKH